MYLTEKHQEMSKVLSGYTELGIGPPEMSVNYSLRLFVGFFNAGQGFGQRRGRSRANVIPCYILGTILIARRNNYKMKRNKSLTHCWILAYSHQLVKPELYPNNAGRIFILLIIWVNAILTAFRELSLSNNADWSLQDLVLSVRHSSIVMKTSKVTIIYGKLVEIGLCCSIEIITSNIYCYRHGHSFNNFC